MGDVMSILKHAKAVHAKVATGYIVLVILVLNKSFIDSFTPLIITRYIS